MITNLYSRMKHGISLDDAVSACSLQWRQQCPWVLLYTPNACLLVKLNDQGIPMDHKGQVVELRQAFEARLFCPAGELRWQRIGSLGNAAFLSEQEDLCPKDWNVCEDVDEFSKVEALEEGHYLLWGESLSDVRSAVHGDWSRLGNARIGEWSVPVAGVSTGKRVVLYYQEYAGPAPNAAGTQHGNVVIREERLLAIKAINENELRITSHD